MHHTFIKETLQELEGKGLRRTLRRIDGAQGAHVLIDGRELINFCSNDYLGLAGDPRLKEAAIASITKDGLGAGASRLICGNMSAHEALEKRLAVFKGVESALVFSTGYMANVGIISSLFGRDDLILWDRLNHASIIDGIKLSGAEHKRYPHHDMEALEKLLKESASFKKRCIITDTVFSMDGDIAPLKEIAALARQYGAMVMVDDAHGFGVLGKTGKGAAELCGVESAIDIQMGTLSKAAGSFGAYCCGSSQLIEFLINKSRSFMFTTGMPPSVAAASVAAIDIIEHEPRRRQQLWKNREYMVNGLKRLGFDTMNSTTPIIPILIGEPEKAVLFSQKLFEDGIFLSAIRPPTVPPNTSRLRLTVMATHTQSDLDAALDKISGIGKDLCLI